VAPTALPPTLRPPRIVPYRALSDDALARRCATGSSEAFTTLFERYRGPLEGYCRSILLDAEDARDATQNALEAALRALPDRDDDRPVKPWLYRIAHNEAISILRRRRPSEPLGAATEASVPGPEVAADERSRLDQLVRDLRSLPERQRGALVMRELNGLDYDEIADALAISPVAARRAVFDARTALHEAADGRDVECGSIRRSLSDGDRRSLRARRIRAHLRSCDACASFQRDIGTRRADLHLLAPWLSGAAVLSAIGVGTGGAAGTGAVIASSAGPAAGLGWAGLPTAAKGLAVAAALATTGTAAVKVEHAARPDDAPRSAEMRRAEPRARPAAAAARAPVAPAEARSVAATPGGRTRPSARPDRVRSEAGDHDATSHLPRVQARRHRAVAPLQAPVDTRRVAPVVQVPEKVVEKVTPVVQRPQVQEVVSDALALAREQVARALELARRATGDGLSRAQTTLQETLATVRATLQRTLATVGVRLPSAPAAPTPAPAPGSQPSSVLSAVTQPVQQVLGGVQSLLSKLTGRG
jgi:RNA polymerase sigma factor (sigma-70 family)